MVDTPTRQRRLSAGDWKNIADEIAAKKNDRKSGRVDLEEKWDEVDRQVAMKPKAKPQGEPDWTPNLPLPMQAETLELLNADGRRLLFPPAEEWFSATTSLTDEDLQKLDFQSYVQGKDTNALARLIDSRGPQVFANAIAEAILRHTMEQYDFRSMIDTINTEAFKYGTWVGRVRPMTAEVFTNEFRGVIADKTRFPVFAPGSIRNVYLDDSPSRALNEGI